MQRSNEQVEERKKFFPDSSFLSNVTTATAPVPRQYLVLSGVHRYVTPSHNMFPYFSTNASFPLVPNGQAGETAGERSETPKCRDGHPATATMIQTARRTPTIPDTRPLARAAAASRAAVRDFLGTHIDPIQCSGCLPSTWSPLRRCTCNLPHRWHNPVHSCKRRSIHHPPFSQLRTGKVPPSPQTAHLSHSASRR
jgi:hypothetical protein